MAKEAALVKEHLEHQRVEKEKDALKAELQRMKQQAAESKAYIEQQEVEERKLLKIISEADAERLRQKKELDQVGLLQIHAYMDHLITKFSVTCLYVTYSPGQTRTQIDTSFKNLNLQTNLVARGRKLKAISLQPCARNHAKENNTENNLWSLASTYLCFARQTVKYFRLLADMFEFDQSDRKST